MKINQISYVFVETFKTTWGRTQENLNKLETYIEIGSNDFLRIKSALAK